MGAGRCVGIDISDEAVIEANERARKCNIDCQFIRSDVYDISKTLYNSFDVVHITAKGIECRYPSKFYSYGKEKIK
jgi:ubiquinone/menaquinone biosynthesis C-methylase UbiE